MQIEASERCELSIEWGEVRFDDVEYFVGGVHTEDSEVTVRSHCPLGQDRARVTFAEAFPPGD